MTTPVITSTASEPPLTTTPPALPRALNERLQAVLTYVETRPESSTVEVAKALGLTTTRAYDSLTALYVRRLIGGSRSLLSPAAWRWFPTSPLVHGLSQQTVATARRDSGAPSPGAPSAASPPSLAAAELCAAEQRAEAARHTWYEPYHGMECGQGHAEVALREGVEDTAFGQLYIDVSCDSEGLHYRLPGMRDELSRSAALAFIETRWLEPWSDQS